MVIVLSLHSNHSYISNLKMNNTKNQSGIILMPLSKLKERLQSEMNDFGLDNIMDKWKDKTLFDGWENFYDVIVIKRMRIECISTAFGIIPKHLSANVVRTLDNSKGNGGSYANLKSIITNIDSYDSLYVKVDILDLNWLQTDYFKENVDENGLIEFCPLEKLLDEVNAQYLMDNSMIYNEN